MSRVVVNQSGGMKNMWIIYRICKYHVNLHHHINPVGDPSQHGSPVPGVYPQTPQKGEKE